MLKIAIPTVAGPFLACYSTQGLARLDFPQPSRQNNPETASADLSAPAQKWHAATTRALKQILSGQPPDALPPLDLSVGTEFQKRVWHALCQIPIGKTQSYAQIAAAIGQPKATRAVGSACGANPIPVLIPCHRVLAAHQRLGGFSGGLDWKRKLLAREGIEFAG
ncbi:MAG: bifunctional transcriptional activator/DNA repair enzyme protein Ada [Pedosphaera sp.]|nr:bifunctional transcriptional activator/DNA repair enzyme protein Ada [Pedosphaera sp.]